jgi:glucose-6-phosphate isomerase
MDTHFVETPLEENLPVILALIGIWNINFIGAIGHAVLPYDQHLNLFPGYLQQADMESNGKSVTLKGKLITTNTGPVIFGAAGTVGQHSFYQLLHQGPKIITSDFIAAAESHTPLGDRQEKLLANYFAQSEALMRGKTKEEVQEELEKAGLRKIIVQRLAPHKTCPGNRPSNSILVRKIDPHTIGKLIALYEHKIFVQGAIWGINSFDQWGVELGKQLANIILPELMAGASVTEHDSSTNGLINTYLKWKPDAP